jgi:nitroreductase
VSFFEVVATRQSVRAFSATAVEADKVRQILEASNQAPSAGNLQAYEIYVVTQPARRRALAEAALHQNFIASAPIVFVFCAHPARSERRYGKRGVQLYSVQDATIACCFAMLAATALGLASVWVGAFNEGSVSRALGAPKSVVPVALLPVGYAAEEPAPTSRRNLSQLVHYESDPDLDHRDTEITAR